MGPSLAPLTRLRRLEVLLHSTWAGGGVDQRAALHWDAFAQLPHLEHLEVSNAAAGAGDAVLAGFEQRVLAPIFRACPALRTLCLHKLNLSVAGAWGPWLGAAARRAGRACLACHRVQCGLGGLSPFAIPALPESQSRARATGRPCA